MPATPKPIEPPFRRLAEILFVIHVFLMLLVVIDVAKHEAAKFNAKPTPHTQKP